MFTCPKCNSTNLTKGYGGCNAQRLCNDCQYLFDINDPDNGEYIKKEEEEKKGGGGCCGKGAKDACDKEKEKEKEEKKGGGGCCGKGAKEEVAKQETPTVKPPDSIKSMCASLPAVVNPVKPSGTEIMNFVQTVKNDFEAISGVTYPPNCDQLKSVSKLVSQYSTMIPTFC